MVTAERPTTDTSGLTQAPGGRTTTTTVDAYRERFGQAAPPAPEEMARHLRGAASLALTLRDGQGRATVGLVAHDGYRTVYDDTGAARREPEDGIAALQEARQRLALQGIDAAVERAPQGGRLWVFTTEPVPAQDLHALLRLATRGQEVEVYPRPERDQSAQPAVRAPLGVHPDDGRRYGFVDAAGRPVGATLAAQVEHLARVRRVDVGRELGARPHLRAELAALDPRAPAPAPLQEPGERSAALTEQGPGQEPRYEAREAAWYGWYVYDRQAAGKAGREWYDEATARERVAGLNGLPPPEMQAPPATPTAPVVEERLAVAQERRAEPRPATTWTRTEDRTTATVRAQLAGMGAQRYDVGAYDRPSDEMLLRREWTPAQVETAVPWLKRMNAQGRDIYIRPSGSSGLYLIDDVPAATVERMRAEGYTPAVVVETSPGNLQAWVRVSDTPLSKEEGTAVARELAERYGGDLSSANWRHMGRLAGFSNQKKEHTQPNGRHPYARLHDAGGVRAPEAPAILERAQVQATQSRRGAAGERDDAGGAEPARDQATRRAAFSRPPAGPVSPLGREYAHRAQRLLERYPDAALTDLHRLDWMVTRDLARAHPESDKEALMRAIREGSPRIEERKRGHVYDYAERTTRYVLLDPNVGRARGEAARMANRERDRWF